jgi:hippurate hydrolase
MNSIALPKIPEQITSRFSPDLIERLVILRRDLHQHPELSEQEEQTANRLEAELNAISAAEVMRIAGTGLVARIPGQDGDAPVVAVRGDIDALPIQEDTGLPFASKNDGVMHACGHDVHASWAIGAAHLLANEPGAGDILVVLQPAEELGRGANAILKSGILDNTAMIFGAHVDRRYETGKAVVQPGPLAAATDTFEIQINGQGGHGARPHESRDPIIAAAALINSLHHIVPRTLDPADAGVVTVGQIDAGVAPNVIPDTAFLAGTLRAVTNETWQHLRDEIKKRAYAISDAYNVSAQVTIKDGTPPIINDETATQYARTACKAELGQDSIERMDTLNMGGEDFACYLDHMPGCFIRIGAKEPGGEFIPAHSPYFYADEVAIFAGAAVLAASARTASAALAM